MAFRGLFVGIDRYASTSISWLNCAKRNGASTSQHQPSKEGYTIILINVPIPLVDKVGLPMQIKKILFKAYPCQISE